VGTPTPTPSCTPPPVAAPALAAPTNVAALPGDGRVDLSWTPGPSTPSATHFYLWRALASNGTFTLAGVSGGATPRFTDWGVTNGQTYWYYVNAVYIYDHGTGTNCRFVFEFRSQSSVQVSARPGP
jgi:hypothetical protein